jgi:hypothetical protein
MAERIVICGAPKSGKTTLAKQMVLAARPQPAWKSTDDTMHMDWSDASLSVMVWLDDPGPWIIEGVAAMRAIRKWLAVNPTGKPCDKVIMLHGGRMDAMGKGVWSVFNQLQTELIRRGVEIEIRYR